MYSLHLFEHRERVEIDRAEGEDGKREGYVREGGGLKALDLLEVNEA